MRRFLPLLLVLFACKSESPSPAPPPVVGNADRGRTLIAQYACNVCHVVPGTQGPQGALGPSLAGVASRPTISYGVVQNTPDKLQRFIRNPAALNPGSSMPPVGLPEKDAQDITAFLLSLK